MGNQKLFKEDEKTGIKLLCAEGFTNKLSRLIETEEILSEETNHLFVKILKELGNEAFLIA